mmetsp:Transcript_80417/g.127008  ORF Transcript_80417/g.127008 Transcript_80417/m.127008 type:complete len:295 (+) Transcript_80417:2-886(+)
MALHKKVIPCEVKSVSRQAWVSAAIVETRPCGSLVVQYLDGGQKVVPPQEVSQMVRAVLYPKLGHECEVWSQSQQKWMKGTISGIYQGRETRDSDLWGNSKSNSNKSDQHDQSHQLDQSIKPIQHPIGSVKVDFQVAGGLASKVVAPEHFWTLLRNIHQPNVLHVKMGPAPTADLSKRPKNKDVEELANVRVLSKCSDLIERRGKDVIAGAVGFLAAQVPVAGGFLGPAAGNLAGEAHVKFVNYMAAVETCSVPQCGNLFKSITGGKVCPICQMKGLDERMIPQAILTVKEWVG